MLHDKLPDLPHLPTLKPLPELKQLPGIPNIIKPLPELKQLPPLPLNVPSFPNFNHTITEKVIQQPSNFAKTSFEKSLIDQFINKILFI